VIDKNSNVKFSPKERQELKNKSIVGIVTQLKTTEAPDTLSAEAKVGS
jgi:hypothetical protein